MLHDVAPARWDGCVRVLAQVDDMARRAGIAVPVTLLVVPCMHGDGREPPDYLRWLRRQAASGHEIAMHGLTHRDDGAPPRDLRAYLLRRVFTQGEGEFAALTLNQCRYRLAHARLWAQEHGLRACGFVPPAWLLDAAAWSAVVDAGFDYTCTYGGVVALPERQALRAPSVMFSTRTAWRRRLSVIHARLQARLAQGSGLLRLDLHPGDADHAAVLRCWLGVLERALREREPLRLHQAAEMARRVGTPDAPEPA